MPQDSFLSQTHHEHELAYAVLVLERQLNAYRRLHEEDLAALRQSIEELKKKILALPDSASSSTDAPRHGTDDSIHSTHS